MVIRHVIAALGAVMLAASTALPIAPAVGKAEPTALWPSDFAAHQVAADCGVWRLDDQDFCVANDSRNGVELGVKFTSSRAVMITGVRIYRVDTGTVRGSLWTSAGRLLARGVFAPPSGNGNGWQDLTFAEPVRIDPDSIYVASYYSPGTKYAFRHHYFANSSHGVGPITALRSTQREPNGVHCYDDAACGSFPVRPYRSSTYWVSPLWSELAGTAAPPQAPASQGPAGAGKGLRVTSVSTATHARRVRPTASIWATFSEPVRRSDLRSSGVRLIRMGNGARVRSKLSYDADRRRVTIDPRSTLRRQTRYRVVVTSRVRAVTGNALDQNPTKSGAQRATWTFRTR